MSFSFEFLKLQIPTILFAITCFISRQRDTQCVPSNDSAIRKHIIHHFQACIQLFMLYPQLHLFLSFFSAKLMHYKITFTQSTFFILYHNLMQYIIIFYPKYIHSIYIYIRVPPSSTFSYTLKFS